MRFSSFLRNILTLARIIAAFALPIYIPLANASNLDPYGDFDPSPVVVSPPAPVAGSLTIDGSDVNEVTYNEQSTSTIQWTSSNADLHPRRDGARRKRRGWSIHRFGPDSSEDP